jgi:hypothetical protein
LPFLAFVDEDGTVTHVEAVVIDSTDQLVRWSRSTSGSAL